MKVYNCDIDNKTELSERELKEKLNFQESPYSDYDFNKLKDLKEFSFIELIAIKGNNN